MIIQYSFNYIHDNGLLTRLLNKISKDAKVEVYLEKIDENYFLEAKGEQSELEELAGKISSVIPNSIFLKSSSVKEIENFTITKIELKDNTKFYAVPFCIECQERILNNQKDLNLDCEVCGFSDVKLAVDDLDVKAIEFQKSGQSELQTFNGKRVFSNSSGSSILCNDYENISEYFIITQAELNALTSVEKPAIRLKPKLKFKLEFNLTEPFYNVFLADDKITLAFCSALKDTKIFFCSDINLLKVCAALDKTLIINSSRDVKDSSTKDEIEMLRSVITEHKLNAPAVCAIHLSHSTESKIFSFNAKVGYTQMVQFVSLPYSINEIFETIKKIDGSGERLIENFKLKFDELYEELIEHKFNNENTQPLTQLFATISLILGLSKSTSIKEASLTLEATAIEFGGKSGPRIDYKVKKIDGIYTLDLIKAVSSAVSFKLAGVDNYLISFGLLDSLADFLATQAGEADANISVNALFLSGDVFENRQLLLRTLNAIEPNFKVYTNEREEIWN